MIPDQAFILCAGLGTRLERISKVIPKAMLPLFDTRLVDIQINYLNQIGIKNIYINVHHHAELFEEHLKENYPQAHILREPTLLGSGGAFHNIVRAGVQGKILALNVDTLYFFEKNLSLLFRDTESHQLLSQKCDSASGYNRLMIDEQGKLLDIVKPSQLSSDLTFSGLSVINLDTLVNIPGVSQFFESVCVPGKGNTEIVTNYGDSEIYDFGTIKDYASSYQKLTSAIRSNAGLWRKYFPDWHKKIEKIIENRILLKLTSSESEELDLVKGELTHLKA